MYGQVKAREEKVTARIGHPSSSSANKEDSVYGHREGDGRVPLLDPQRAGHEKCAR